MKLESKHFIYLVLYVDDILLASMSLSLLNNTKVFLSKKFDTKDLGEASLYLALKSRETNQGIYLTYLIKTISTKYRRLKMHNCASGDSYV